MKAFNRRAFLGALACVPLAKRSLAPLPRMQRAGGFDLNGLLWERVQAGSVPATVILLKHIGPITFNEEIRRAS